MQCVGIPHTFLLLSQTLGRARKGQARARAAAAPAWQHQGPAAVSTSSRGQGQHHAAGQQSSAIPSLLLPGTHSGMMCREQSLFGGCFYCSCSASFPSQSYEIKGVNSSSRDLRPFDRNIACPWHRERWGRRAGYACQEGSRDQQKQRKLLFCHG